MDEVKDLCLDLFGTDVAFPSLEILSIKNMKMWEVWSTKSGAVGAVFPRLRELYIEDCPNLVDVSFGALDSVRRLKISSCGDSVLKSLINVASLTTTLEINSIEGLTKEVWDDVLEYLGAIEKLTIKSCDELIYLWRSELEAAKVLGNLRTLAVHSCKKLLSLGEKEEDDNYTSNLTSLRSLSYMFCNSMKHVICPNNIEKLHLFNCTSITNISFPTGGGKNLKLLYIIDCPQLLEKEFGVLTKTSMSMLEVVHIRCFSNLKSITELGCFIHLTKLLIRECPSIESFPAHHLQSLTLLKDLEIRNCPSMDASIPCGLWPPKLCTLTIGRLNKPMSDWGPQNFPTSLVKLILCGGLEADVRSCNQLTEIIPSSLTCLHINDFKNLESLSTGLQHLTSLQHLAMHDCRSLKDLPEMLLPSLLSLAIFRCPYLEKRISGKGSDYRRIISHIPSLK